MITVQGVYTALITPFKDGNINFYEFERIISEQCQSGVSGVVVAGTTGEAATLTEDEFIALIKSAKQISNNKISIIAGVGSCNTLSAVHKTKLATELNVDGLLAVTPYYNKPTQNGLVDYYSQIALATTLPIIMYSIPSRCCVEISTDTAQTLIIKHKNIVGIKEATDSCKRVNDFRNATNKNFSILAGNDSMLLPFMSLGANGIITATANLLSKEILNITNLCIKNKFQEALDEYKGISHVIDLMSIEVNPLPIKYLMYKTGKISSPECRSPLGGLSQHSKDILDQFAKNW